MKLTIPPILFYPGGRLIHLIVRREPASAEAAKPKSFNVNANDVGICCESYTTCCQTPDTDSCCYDGCCPAGHCGCWNVPPAPTEDDADRLGEVFWPWLMPYLYYCSSIIQSLQQETHHVLKADVVQRWPTFSIHKIHLNSIAMLTEPTVHLNNQLFLRT